MSKDTFNSLKDEAISRMSPYELVERAVALQSERQNTLGIDPIELEDGATLHTVASSLTTGSELRSQLALEDGRMIHRQVMRAPATLLAHVVELRPPGLDSENGNAMLYRIKDSLPLPLTEASAPFRTTALRAINGEAGVKGVSPIRFDGISNTLYRSFPWEEQGADYLHTVTTDLTILATEKTQVQLQEIGKDELDKEVGVLATVSGLAQVALHERHFVRVTDSGVSYGPAEAQVLEINIPPNMAQEQKSEYYRIPDDATVVANKDGHLVPTGHRAQDRKYMHTTLNPYLGPEQALTLIGGTEALDWTEGTDAFLESTAGSDMAWLLPLDVRGSYSQTRQLARDKIREITANRSPQVGDVGCLAVAAHVTELSLPSGGRQVDPLFFRNTR